MNQTAWGGDSGDLHYQSNEADWYQVVLYGVNVV